MAQIDDEIKRLIRQTVEHDDLIFQGIVTEVNEEEFTCTVRRDDQVNYYDVRLRGLVNEGLQGFAFIPKMKSTVLVCHIGKSNELFVCKFTEIEKVVFTSRDLTMIVDKKKVDLKKGQVDLQVTAEGITIKKGASGLKRTLSSLLDAICQLTVPTPTGPSGIPINVAIFQQIKTDLSNYLEG